MALSKKLASIKRFGARYGRTVKHKLGLIEYTQRNSTKCPYCSKHTVKRVSKGIWYCKKCKSKFAGRAYTYSNKGVKKEYVEGAEELEGEFEASNEA